MSKPFYAAAAAGTELPVERMLDNPVFWVALTAIAVAVTMFFLLSSSGSGSGY
jgi:hypothetical protein